MPCIWWAAWPRGRTAIAAVSGTLMLSSKYPEMGSASTRVLAKAATDSGPITLATSKDMNPKEARSHMSLGGGAAVRWIAQTASLDLCLCAFARSCAPALAADGAPEAEHYSGDEHRNAAGDTLLLVEGQAEALAEAAPDDVSHPWWEGERGGDFQTTEPLLKAGCEM